MSGEKRRPATYGKDLGFVDLALTKEDHDRLVEGRGRPVTDDPIGTYSKGSKRGTSSGIEEQDYAATRKDHR